MKDESDITKTFVVGILETLKGNLERIIEGLEPEENERIIMVREQAGKPRFYLTGGGTKDEYVSSTATDVIRKHARIRYRRDARRAAERELAQVERCLDILRDRRSLSDINKVYDKLPEALKPYVDPLPLSDEEYARKWQEGNVIVKRKRIHAMDDYHKFKTMRGDYVGSKSEALIADRLYVAGIPYHYEVAFIPEAEAEQSLPVYNEYGRIVGYEVLGFDPHDRDTLHPDFLVLNKKTRKSYFWEHLGKMDDQKYCLDNLNRFVRVTDAGYTIGEDILITHESSRNPLRLETIDRIIEKHLK